jgi:hypothetical protein
MICGVLPLSAKPFPNITMNIVKLIAKQERKEWKKLIRALTLWKAIFGEHHGH